MIRGKSDPKTPACIFRLHVTDANPSSRSPQSHTPRGELGLQGICTSSQPCLVVKKLGETLLPERTMKGQAQSGHSRAPWWIPVVWSGWPGLRSLLWENREASRFFLINFLREWLLYNVVLVSTVPQNESAIHIHISPLFWISFPFRSPHSTELGSLCYTAYSH